MPVYPISTSNLSTILNRADHDPSSPIFMLNMWKYRDQAVYAPEHEHLSTGPCTGKEACLRYREAIQDVLPANAAIFAHFGVLTEAAAPKGEKWDYVVLVRYENLQGFIDMVESVKYKEDVLPHRLAGLEEWRLICLDKMEV